MAALRKPIHVEVCTMTCPTRDELASCLIGQMAAWQTEHIFRHMEDCAQCRLALEAIEKSLDQNALLGCSDLQSIREHATQSMDSACEKLIRRAAQLATRWRPTSAESESNNSSQRHSRNIRDYQLQSIVGTGGMGTVYSAWHVRLKRHVALKVLSAAHSRSEHAVRHFLCEMAAVGRLNHPHIIRALDAGICDGVHYLAMDLVDGLDVGEVLRRLGKLDVANAAKIAAEIADALAYAHSCGLVHRDVKPSNIMLATAGKALLLDLGLALLTESNGRDLDHPHVLGSLHYLAPEQATDCQNVNAQADVYGLGCTLYHLLAGQPPFAANPEFSDRELLAAHAKCQPPALTDKRRDLPAELVSLVQGMLDKSPRNRPGTQQISRELAPLAADADLPTVVRRARHITTNRRPAYGDSRPIKHQPTATNGAGRRLQVLVSLLCLLAGIRWATWTVPQRSLQVPTAVVHSRTPRVAADSMAGLTNLLRTGTHSPPSCLTSSTIVALNESENKIYTIQDAPGSQLRIEITSATGEDKTTVTCEAWDYLDLKRKYPEQYDKLAWTWLWKTNPSGALEEDGWQVISCATVRSIDGGKFRFAGCADARGTSSCRPESSGPYRFATRDPGPRLWNHVRPVDP